MEIPKRIIVIDDDSINNMFCKYIINEALDDKVEIMMFTRPQKAIDYINSEYQKDPVPTLMFLDINMPVLSGWDVLDALVKSDVIINQYFKIYMLSSSVDPKDKEKANNSNLVKGFIEKPLDVNIIRKICGMIYFFRDPKFDTITETY